MLPVACGSAMSVTKCVSHACNHAYKNVIHVHAYMRSCLSMASESDCPHLHTAGQGVVASRELGSMAHRPSLSSFVKDMRFTCRLHIE